MVRNLQLMLGAAGIILGFVIGFSVRPLQLSQGAIWWIGLPGELFLRLLRMTIVPVITSSVITGTSSMRPADNGKIGGLLLLGIIVNGTFAVVLGIILAVTIKPGSSVGVRSDEGTEDVVRLGTSDIIADMLMNIVPDNVVRVTIQKAQTKYIYVNIPNSTAMGEELYKKEMEYVNSINILGLMVASFIFGLALAEAGPAGRSLMKFFESVLAVTMVVMRWFMWLSPVGIGSLICGAVASIEDLRATLTQLGLFTLAVSIGLLIITFLYLPLCYLVIVRKNPFRNYKYMGKAWMISFAAAASAPGIPEMYKSCDQCHVDKRIAAIGVPTSVTLTSNGSALFVVVSCIFMAQIANLHIGIETLCLLGAMVVILTCSLPSVPSSSIVVMVIIMTSLGIPSQHFGVLFAVEWFLDRFRTSVNMITHLMLILTVDRVAKRYGMLSDSVNDCNDNEYKNAENQLTAQASEEEGKLCEQESPI